MHLLLTNDDGIHAPGLEALRQAASHFGRVTVIAPDQHLSGCGHQTTTSRPLKATLLDEGRYAVNGTPADCTRIGVLHLASDADWVLSGINDGGNLGVDTYMSGTVAGAREAMLMGRRSVAFSQYRRRGNRLNWHRAAQFARVVLAELLHEPLATGSFWNVNFPDDDSQDLPERVQCLVDPSPLSVALEEIAGEYHYRSNYHERLRQEGTDIAVCFAGQIAISRIVHHATS